MSEARYDFRNLKEFAIDTLEISYCNLLKSIQGIKPEEVFKQVHPEINAVGWIVGHCAAHMHTIFVKKCQGKTIFPGKFKFSIKRLRIISPFSFRELVDSFMQVADSTFSYLQELTEEKLRGLPEKSTRKAKYQETVLELIHRLALHFTGHTGQIRIIRKELGNPAEGFFVAGISKSSRKNLLEKWKLWWAKSRTKFP